MTMPTAGQVAADQAATAYPDVTGVWTFKADGYVLRPQDQMPTGDVMLELVDVTDYPWPDTETAEDPAAVAADEDDASSVDG